MEREFLLVLIATNFSVCHSSNYQPLAVINHANDTGKTSRHNMAGVDV